MTLVVYRPGGLARREGCVRPAGMRLDAMATPSCAYASRILGMH